jgi:hypothetical protein
MRPSTSGARSSDPPFAWLPTSRSDGNTGILGADRPWGKWIGWPTVCPSRP